MSGVARFEYTVACPKRGAEKLQPCRSVYGKWAYPHARRSNIVIEAWRLGYADGLDELTQRFEGMDVTAKFIRGDVQKRLEGGF